MLDRADILTIIKRNIQDVIPTIPSEHITLTNSLKELGANSLDRAEIIMSTLRELKLAVPLMTFASAKNIGDLVIALERELTSASHLHQ